MARHRCRRLAVVSRPFPPVEWETNVQHHRERQFAGCPRAADTARAATELRPSSIKCLGEWPRETRFPSCIGAIDLYILYQ